MDIVAHGDVRDPELARSPEREPFQSRLLDRLPTDVLARDGRPQRASVRRRLGCRAVVPFIGGIAGQRAAGAAVGDDAFVVGMAGEFDLNRAQRTGQRRGQAGGDRLAVVTNRERAVGSLYHFDPRASVVGSVGAGQELQRAPAVLDGVVPRSSWGQAQSNRARLLEGEDRAQVERRVERAVNGLRLRRLDPEAGVEAG